MNKDIPSYELCKKLKELGFDIDTEIYRIKIYDNKYYAIREEDENRLTMQYSYVADAPTIWEMIDVLPKRIKESFELVIRPEEWKVAYANIEWVFDEWDWLRYVKYIQKTLPESEVFDDSLSNALAKTLIWCIENWHLDPKLLD